MLRHFNRRKAGRGFTLIELLIVIAIILILIAIALPNFLEAQIRARVSKVKSELRTLETAMMSYYLDWKTYPAEHERDEPPTNRRQRGFMWLTSPIAYVTSLLQDPFAEFTADSAVTNFITYESGGIEKGGNPFTDCGGICMTTWVMFSNGPAGQQNIWAANPHFDSGRDIVNYSPTNGTKSRGEIYKWGGDAYWIGVQTANGNAEKLNAVGSNNIISIPGLTIDSRFYRHTMPENK